MTPEQKLKAQNMLIIVGISLLFGLLYNYLFYPHTVTEFVEASVISILIGLVVGIVEEYILVKSIKRRSFLTVSFVRTVLYTLVTTVILCLVLSIEITYIEQLSYTEAILKYAKSPLFKRDFIFTFCFIALILFIFQIIVLIGRGNFLRLIIGRYHQPSEVSRIFMFVDLKGSTSIAEQLTNKQYSAFIKDYFYDISDAINMYSGEIYQYVGDEIAVVWPIRKNNANCIKSFFKMKAIIASKKEAYIKKYGLVPIFKAGIHVGSVILTSVGKQKKELVYHGDVLNTTSRIEGKCNELDQQLLISQDLIDILNLDDDYEIKEKGEIELRGKAAKLSLYGIDQKL